MTRPIWSTSALVMALLIAGWSAWAEDQAAGAMTIADGRQVSLEYTLTLGDGTEAGTNVGQEPLVYIHGRGELVSIGHQGRAVFQGPAMVLGMGNLKPVGTEIQCQLNNVL